jgi:hypothetical protein
MIARVFRFKGENSRRAARQTTNCESPQLRLEGRDQDTAFVLTRPKAIG